MSNEMTNPQTTGFSEDYVKELRQEAAGWRTKVRELERQTELSEIKIELLKKGIDVNPKWVEVQEGQSIPQAIQSFVENYPQFMPQEGTSTPRQVPRVTSLGSQNSNAPGPSPTGSFQNRTPSEIKKDPKARAALRRRYREMLAQASNKNYQGE